MVCRICIIYTKRERETRIDDPNTKTIRIQIHNASVICRVGTPIRENNESVVGAFVSKQPETLPNYSLALAPS